MTLQQGRKSLSINIEKIRDKKILTIIPAYNEKDNIGKVVRELRNTLPAIDILVIDDGSTQDFEDEVLKAGAWMVRHPVNLGYGNALQTGYKFAVRRGYDIVAQMDGDGQHDPTFIPIMIEKLLDENLDVVIGSRFLGECHYNVGLLKNAGIKLFRTLVSVIIRKKLTDVTSGYQVLARNAVRFCTRDIYPSDFPDADVILMLHFYGFRIGEIGVRMFAGPPKRSMHYGLASLFYVFKMFLSMFLMLIRKRP